MDKDQIKVQRIVALAISDHTQAVIDILADSYRPGPLIGETSHGTVVNAVRMQMHGEIVRYVVDTLQLAKDGKLIPNA